MATANVLFDNEDDEDTNNLRYFDIPYPINDDKQSLSSILNSSLLEIEETIKPLIHLIDDVETKVYIIKQKLTVNDNDDLTLDELTAIHLYISEESTTTKSLFYLLNQAIRRGFTQEFQLWFSYLNLLLRALGKLPSIGNDCTIYRGVKSCDLSDQYKDDGIYTWFTFASCLRSIDQMKLSSFLGKQGVRTIFKIYCYSGKQIPLSDDDEVILMPGFHFQVIGKLPSLDDLITIFIREIPPSSNETMSSIPIVNKLEIPEQSLSSIVKTTKQFNKNRKSLKNTANRIIKITKVLNICNVAASKAATCT